MLNNVANLISESFLLVVVAAAFVAINAVGPLFAFAYFALVIGLMQYFIGRSLKQAGRGQRRGPGAHQQRDQ